MTSVCRKTPLVLVILDGWGVGNCGGGSAIEAASLPVYRHLLATYPHSLLSCSGEDVGLPEGQMGNSEVGHLNIGAGRIVYQELTRISRSIRDGSFFSNPVLKEAIARARQKGGALHLMGLLSDGGVHSHIDHLFALLELAGREGMHNVYVHAFLDGRDVPPDNAGEYISALDEKLAGLGFGAVATVMGRYYAMDRDRRWERTERAYNAIVYSEGLVAHSAAETLAAAYERGETDEFVQPTVVLGPSGEPPPGVKPGDSVIFFNFRPDRARQLTRAFVDRDFNGFTRKNGHPGAHFTCMTLYDKTIDAPVAFMPQELRNTLGEVLSQNGITQLRLAETEKYAHVTFFFNGGREEPYPGEERVLVPSPKVATYDLKPEMSAPEVTRVFKEKLASDRYGVIIMNYANPDMVGHTGDFLAAVRAVEAVDTCLGEVVRAVQEKDGTLIVTADHGNCEKMKDEEGHPCTSHTTNPVPFILVGKRTAGYVLKNGRLEDIAPTVLHLLGIPVPAEMTGSSLIVAKNNGIGEKKEAEIK